MVFTDSDLPEFVTQDIGGTYAKVVLIPHLPPTEGGANPPVPFNDVDNIFFVHGQVDILATANSGTARKGLYQVGAFIQDVGYLFQQKGNITFNTLQDARASATDVQNIYFSQNGTPSNGSNTFFATNFLINNVSGYQTRVQTWNSAAEQQGQTTLCGYAKNYPQGLYAEECFPVFIDNTPPTMTFEDTSDTPWPNQTATSSNTIVVAGNDTGSGVYTINVNNLSFGGSYNETSTNTAPGPDTPAYSATFPFSGTLADGQYSATVTDLAGNQATLNFEIRTSSPVCATVQNAARTLLSSIVTSTNAVVLTSTGDPAGICSIAITGPNGPVGFSNFTASLDAVLGVYPSLASGTYTTTVTDCAGNICQSSFTIVAASTGAITNCVSGTSSACNSLDRVNFDTTTIATDTMTVTVASIANCTTAAQCSVLCAEMQVSCFSCPGGGSDPGCQGQCYMGPRPGPSLPVYAYCNFSSVSDATLFTVTSTNSFAALGVTVTASIYSSTGAFLANILPASYANSEALQTLVDSLTIAEYGQTTKMTSADGVASLNSLFAGVSISPQTPTSPMTASSLSKQFAVLGPVKAITGSDFVFTSTQSISFSTTPAPGITVDTTTLAIYQFSGVAWSSANVTNQSVSVSSLGVVTVTGSFFQSGTYAMFYVGHDVTPPVTTFSIQGSSFNFNGTALFSTSTYAVLVATDPLVSGFASQVATITYCLDPSSNSVFSVYTSSFPLPLGTHVLQYRSIDYAGNVEAVNTTTFTVTAGTAFKETSDDAVAGNLLVGFLGSGAQAEVVARAQDSTTLQISSANHWPMLNVTNIGSVGVGVQIPQAQLDVASSDVALQLKSGNLTSTGTSVQTAFGFNGDVSMRHAIETFHSTAAVGNEMDFFVWTPDAGSTTTIATTKMLALQASAIPSNGSMLGLPTGPPDAELVVSNGVTTGGGTMQRLQVLTPSSKRFKSDIKYLKEKDEDRALSETAALRHVRFRYRSRAKNGSLYDDPAQPVRVGLIYEEAPESIRGKGPVLQTNERLANVEMALKAAMRKLDALDKRYKALKARKKP